MPLYLTQTHCSSKCAPRSAGAIQHSVASIHIKRPSSTRQCTSILRVEHSERNASGLLNIMPEADVARTVVTAVGCELLERSRASSRRVNGELWRIFIPKKLTGLTLSRFVICACEALRTLGLSGIGGRTSRVGIKQCSAWVLWSSLLDCEAAYILPPRRSTSMLCTFQIYNHHERRTLLA